MGKKTSKALVARGKRKLQQIAAFFRKLWRIKKVRIACFVLAGLILLSEVVPLVVRSLQAANYDLAAIKTLVDPTGKDLRQKLTYDDKTGAWAFNANAADQLPGQSGDGIKVGGLTYSAQLPKRMSGKSGLKMTDAAAKLDMTMTPQFGLSEGRIQEGYAVYPIKGSDAQLVYTFQQGGVKEDIILHQAPGDKTTFAYTLDLPDSLEARLERDGSVGIYGGSRTLFGNISYGSDKDKELVEKARKSSKKTELYYAIPAPVIKGDKDGSAKAKFRLDGKKLTIEVTGLKKAHYPLSIDPSFVMSPTSCSWRQGGNNEDNVDYGSIGNCYLKRSNVSGGVVTGNWTASTSAATGHLPQTGVSGFAAYNGYLYAVASQTGSGGADGVWYAPINASTGAVGQFVETTNTQADRRSAGVVIVNGYIYAIGGINVQNTTEYALICTGPNSNPAAGCGASAVNGSVGTWTYGPNLNVGRASAATMAYSGRIYVVSGCSAQALFCTGWTNVTEYATIRGNGSLSGWTQSTSAADGHVPVAVHDGTGLASNGYLYLIGGQGNGGVGVVSTVYYAPIKNDGSVGAWANAGVSLPVVLRGLASVVSNGYLYVLGGDRNGPAQNVVYLAKIYADGKLGPFQTTTSFTTNRSHVVATTYNGRIYLSGGDNAGAPATEYQDTQYATISTSPGGISPFATDSDPIMAANGIREHASVVYGGYIYVLGGNNAAGSGQTFSNQVRYARLNADGTVGAWAGTSAFATPRLSHAAVAHNGYMYVMGGQISGGSYPADIQKATINADGTLGSWSSAGGDYSTTGRDGLGAVVYNGYIYIMGGNYNTNSSISAEIDIAPLNADGTVGTWTNNTSGLNLGGRSNFGLAQSGKYIYLLGGRAPGSFEETNAWKATLGGSGTISSWSDAGFALPENRHWMATDTYNGYLYMAGGQTAAGINWTMLNNVKYIKINMNDGSLTGGWATSPVTLPAVRSYQAGVVYNGYLYNTAGCTGLSLGACNGSFNDVVYTQIYNGGGGADGAWVTGPTSSTITRYAPMTVASSGYLIVMGGCTTIVVGNCTAITNSSTYAPINPDGSLGSWTTGTTLPGALDAAGATVANGYVYLVGGCSAGGCSTVQNTVSSALICTGSNNGVDGCSATGGTLGTWHTLNTISARWGTAAVAVNGYLYAAGGINGSGTNLNDVQSAQILPNGGLGSWGSVGSGATFTTARGGHGLVSYGDYLYILGGSTGSSQLSDVQMAQVQSGGQLGAWSSTTGMPATSLLGLAAAANGYMYYSGTRSSTLTNQTMYAPIYSNGTLGSWKSTAGNNGTTAVSGFAGAVYNGYMYRAGGFDLGTAISNASYYAPLQATPQIARHSMLLTTDTRTLPANFFTTVAPQSNNSSINAGVSTANDPAVILNSLGINNRLISATKYQLTPGNDGTKYYWLQVALDDSQSMTWDEATSSSMSYMQLNYHANPGKRLRGGKTFNQNAIQSLDAR